MENARLAPRFSIMHLLLALLIAMLARATACRESQSEAPTPALTETPAVDARVETGSDYLDPALPAAVRADDLLQQMTLAEKIGQMTLVEKNSIARDHIARLGIGALFSGGGGSPPGNRPEEWLEMVIGFQEHALESRLAIPLLYGVDAIHGHNNVKGATIFPHNIGLGATADPNLLRQIGRATAVEVSATGINWNYAPVLAVGRDPRWGRYYEIFSEDPELVATLGTAYLRGLQGDDPGQPETVLGTPKHFVGDGGTAWGTSTTDDYEIDQGDTQVDEATLRAVHLAPYRDAVDAGALAIMASFSSWNGDKVHGNRYLLTEVLKEELAFSGFIVSDWQAIDQIDSNYYEAVVKAINAGIDMNMVPFNYELFIAALTAAVDNGDVSQVRIDDAVHRILRVKFELGLFDHPLPAAGDAAQVGADAQRVLARQAVSQSLVLLQNGGGVLPIAKETPLIFVAGVGADDVGMQSGGWTIEWQGGMGNITPGTTILDGVEGAVSPETEVVYNRFGNYDRVTNDNGEPAIADVGIVVVGEEPYAEGVGDRADLSLNQIDADLIARVSERSEQVVVIILSGRPLLITDHLDQADAWIAAWLPGSEGQGIVDNLFGDHPFTGTLPVSWPRTVEQIPFDFGNLPAAGCEAPLFPLGYGLTTADTAPVLLPEGCP